MPAAATKPRITDLMIEAAREKGIQVTSYEDLEARFKAERRIDVRDALGSSNHFENWRRKRGLPTVDDEGKHYRSSEVYIRLYDDDPDGAAARPAYVDLWHWLLNAFDDMPWDETSSERTKAVPVIPGMVAIPAPPTEEELAQGRARLESQSGPLPDDAWETLAKDIRQRNVKATRIAELVKIATDWHGGAFVVTMRVGR